VIKYYDNRQLKFFASVSPWPRALQSIQYEYQNILMWYGKPCIRMTKLSERLEVRNIYSKGCDAVASCIAAISELSTASSATKT